VSGSAVPRSHDGSSLLGTFVSLLASDAGDVGAILARVLDRPDLRVAYWLPGGERWVDAEGERLAIDPAQPGVTEVMHRGGRIAALLHDAERASGPELSGNFRAAVELALENRRLQLVLRARLEEEQALRRVATVVARQHDPDEVFALVTKEVARHLDADASMTASFGGPGVATVLAEWSAPGIGHFPMGRQIRIGGPTALAQVQATGAPGRVDSYEGMPGDYPAELCDLGMRAAVAAPIMVDGRLWGAVAAGSAGAPFTADTEARLAAFAELVGQAIANVDARMQLNESRARIVQAADNARRRIERDLHDGAQQRLVALALSLGMVAKTAEPATAAAVEACVRDLNIALAELRELARGIHPMMLTERGLEPALQALATRTPVEVAVDSTLERRLPEAQEAALYFVAAEAITNVVRHAEARSVAITVRSADGWAEITVADDGIGGATITPGSGLRGLADRLDALRGRIAVESTPGAGTTVRARVPIPAAR
jgi:signal transduction histidine kinase